MTDMPMDAPPELKYHPATRRYAFRSEYHIDSPNAYFIASGLDGGRWVPKERVTAELGWKDVVVAVPE